MAGMKVLEQHIALFGESGSGKTVMLSSFYGSEQESHHQKAGVYNLVAEDAAQGIALHQNYLGMKNDSLLPEATKFRATAYSFLLKLKGSSDASPLKSKPYDAVRLVWHDYPGEWFSENPSGPEEASRRVETFRTLLSSHVALVLVDGQKLLDNAGHEERYLKSLLTTFRNSLILLKDDLLQDGKPLVAFPRIWVITLSKADLLPDLDVNAFQELVIQKAGAEVIALREVLASLVDSQDALAVGDDFVRMSSARFSPESIEVTERIGLDLMLPIAAMLPLERHLKWLKAKKLSHSVGRVLLDNTVIFAGALGAAKKLLSMVKGPKGKLTGGAVSLAVTALLPRLEAGLNSAREHLAANEQDAQSKRENLIRLLDLFLRELDAAEEKAVLRRGTA